MRRTWLLLPFLVSALAACAAPGDGGLVDDALPDNKADGFFFQRDLAPEELPVPTEQPLEGHFDPDRYVAYAFSGEAGQGIRLFTWRDYGIGEALLDTLSGNSAPRMSHALFVWNPVAGSKDETDEQNWDLLRLTSGKDDWTFSHYDALTNVVLPETGRYLLLTLATRDAYENQVEYYTQTETYVPDEEDVRPGNLELTVKYTSDKPVEGLRVAIGDQEQRTDERGQVTFSNLVPNTYTVKFGTDGYEHLLVQVIPGGDGQRTVWLDHPLP